MQEDTFNVVRDWVKKIKGEGDSDVAGSGNESNDHHLFSNNDAEINYLTSEM